MGLFFIIRGQLTKTSEWRDGAEARRVAIQQLIDKRADYAQAMNESKELETLLKNPAMSIPSFVEGHTQSLSIQKPTDFRDSRQPVAGRADVTAISTEVSFPKMSLGQLSSFSEKVVNSDKLIYMQRLQIRHKERSNDYEVTMQLTTYQNAEKNKEDDR